MSNLRPYVTLYHMRYAIFSDIHNHTSALSLVLAHAKTQSVDGYYCLGDVGIDECVALVRAVNAPTVFGNWEVSNWWHLSSENRRWVLSLPSMRKLKTFWLTHAAPFWPQNLVTLADLNANRYQVPLSRLFPYLHYDSEAVWETMAMLTEAKMPLMFHGHTHRQIVWRFNSDNELQRVTERTITLKSDEALVVGVGSVGHPMDGPKPSYIVYDDSAGVVEMIRV